MGSSNRSIKKKFITGFKAQKVVDDLIDYIFDNCEGNISKAKKESMLKYINKEYDHYLIECHENSDLDYSYVLEKIRDRSLKDIRIYISNITELQKGFNGSEYKPFVYSFFYNIKGKLKHAEKKRIAILNHSKQYGIHVDTPSQKGISDCGKSFIIGCGIIGITAIIITVLLLCTRIVSEIILWMLKSMSPVILCSIWGIVILILISCICMFFSNKATSKIKTTVFFVSFAISLFSATFNLISVDSVFKIHNETNQYNSVMESPQPSATVEPTQIAEPDKPTESTVICTPTPETGYKVFEGKG